MLTSLTFVSWFPVERPVFSALPRGNAAYAFLEFDSCVILGYQVAERLWGIYFHVPGKKNA